MDSTQQLNYISKAYNFKYFAYSYILNHPSNVIAQLTKMCRPVGCCQLDCRPVVCRSVGLSPR